MTENYLILSREDRFEALGVAATASGRPVHLLEKDIWVVWAIDGLFSADFGKHLVFKGGTSLSKAYKPTMSSEDFQKTLTSPMTYAKSTALPNIEIRNPKSLSL